MKTDEHFELNIIPIRSLKLPKLQMEIRKHGLEIVSEAWLMDRFGVATLDEVLEQQQLFEWADVMEQLIQQTKDEN